MKLREYILLENGNVISRNSGNFFKQNGSTYFQSQIEGDVNNRQKVMCTSVSKNALYKCRSDLIYNGVIKK